MAKTNNTFNSEFYCTRCGNKGLPIVRRKGYEREAGHLKRIFCLHCKEEVNHVECKEFTKYTYQDFLVERERDNFDLEGNRKITYGELKGVINNENLQK